MSKLAIAHSAPLPTDSAAPTNLVACLQKRIESRPDGRLWEYSLAGDHCSANYMELWQRAGYIVANLQARGIGPGTPVIILLESVLDFVPGMWACFRAGLVPVPMNSISNVVGRGDRQVFSSVVEAFPEIIVIHDEFHQSVGEYLFADYGLQVLNFCQLDIETDRQIATVTYAANDLACVLHSSGSTGSAKLVCIDHRAMLERSSARRKQDQSEQMTRHLGWFALDSVSGRYCLAATASCYVYLPARDLLARPRSLLDALDHFRIEYMSVTSYLSDLVVRAVEETEACWDLSHLHRVGVGAEPVVWDAMNRFSQMLTQFGAPAGIVYAGYGMTETTVLSASEEALKVEFAEPVMPFASLGKPLPGVSIRVMDEHDCILEEGQTGQIQVLSPGKMFSSYAGRADLTAESFTVDGWFRTGDQGFMLDDELTISGRSRDIVIVNGKNYALMEIEAVLSDIDGLDPLQLVACSLRSQKGQATDSLAIFFVPVDRQPANVMGLVTKIHRVLNSNAGISPDYVVPLWSEQIPRTSSGKLQRFQLVEDYLQGKLHLVAAMFDASKSGIADLESDMSFEKKVVSIWQQVLKLDAEPGMDDDFFADGGHSLLSHELIIRLEEQLGREVPVAQFMMNPTLGGLLQALKKSASEIVQKNINQSPWPMSFDLHKKLLSFVGGWDGERQSPDSLISVLNPEGSQTPLFWVFHDGNYFSRLARHMGPEQPIYGMRAGNAVTDNTEIEVQSIALAYVEELEGLYPEGVIFIGGSCLAAKIALAMAQHLLRRGRQVSRLFLLEWPYRLLAYPGPVTLLFGRESARINPDSRFKDPHLGWQRAFHYYDVDYISGKHGQSFTELNIRSLAVVLQRKLVMEDMPAMTLLPASAYQTEISVIKQPQYYVQGAKAVIAVTVRNTSTILWRAYSESGLALANSWQSRNGHILTLRDGSTPLPNVTPNEQIQLDLEVRVPSVTGEAVLVIDLVEEGCTWFNSQSNTALRLNVRCSAQGDFQHLHKQALD